MKDMKKISLITLLIFTLIGPVVFGAWMSDAARGDEVMADRFRCRILADDAEIDIKSVEIIEFSFPGDSELRIPDRIRSESGEDFKVDRIGSEAFREHNTDKLTKIIFTSHIDIDNQAFVGCPDLEEVVFEEDTGIKEEAFCNLPKLKNVDLTNCYQLGDMAFKDCNALKKVTVSYDLENAFVGDEVFYGCPISEVVIKYPYNSTESNKDLIGKIRASIPGSASVKGILQRNASVDAAWSEPELNKTELNDYAVGSKAIQLEAVNLYANLTDSMKFPGAAIEKEPLTGNYSWESSDPDIASVTQNGLVTPHSPGRTTIKLTVTAGSNSKSATCVVNVTAKRIGDYEFDPSTGTILRYLGTASNISVPSSLGGVKVKKIGANAFSQSDTIENVTIPNTVTEIGESAFEPGIKQGASAAFTSKLKKVTIPAGVKKIENQAFARTALESVNIPGSVTSMGLGVFFECRSLKKAVLAEGVAKVSDSMFKGSSALTAISLPASLKAVGEYAFQASGLKEAALPKGLEEIGKGAFSNCTGLLRAALPSGSTKLGIGIFTDCSELSSITLPEGMKKIPAATFFNCTKLDKVVLPKSLQEVEGNAFENCLGLEGEGIVIPNSITSLGNAAFMGIENIKVKVLYCGEKNAQGKPAVNHDVFTAAGVDNKIAGYIIGVPLEYNPVLNKTEIRGIRAGSDPVKLEMNGMYPENLPSEINKSNSSIETLSVTWKSDKASIAQVDLNGTVTPISAGTAVISATAQGKTASCKVIVDGGTLTFTAPGGIELPEKTKAVLAKTEPVKSAVAAGEDAAVLMIFDKKERQDVSEDAQLIDEILDGDQAAAAYYNIGFQAVINNRMPENISEAAGDIELSFPMTGIEKAKSYKVARVHKGRAVLLNAIPDQDGTLLKTTSSLFSTYAVIREGVSAAEKEKSRRIEKQKTSVKAPQSVSAAKTGDSSDPGRLAGLVALMVIAAFGVSCGCRKMKSR